MTFAAMPPFHNVALRKPSVDWPERLASSPRRWSLMVGPEAKSALTSWSASRNSLMGNMWSLRGESLTNIDLGATSTRVYNAAISVWHPKTNLEESQLYSNSVTGDHFKYGDSLNECFLYNHFHLSLLTEFSAELLCSKI